MLLYGWSTERVRFSLGYPVFVAGINPVDNTVVVGREEEVFQQELLARITIYRYTQAGG